MLDLLPDPKPDVEIAHQKEEKEEIEQETETKVKRSKKTSAAEEGEEDDLQSQLINIAKYGLIGTGIAFLVYQIFFNKRKRKKEPDMQELMMMMMYQMMMIQMQHMQKTYNTHETTTLPPEVVTDDGTKFNTDWSKWYDENKDKEFKEFGTSSSKTLNQLHISENWKVRRDLNGKITDVYKVNEYIR